MYRYTCTCDPEASPASRVPRLELGRVAHHDVAVDADGSERHDTRHESQHRDETQQHARAV